MDPLTPEEYQQLINLGTTNQDLASAIAFQQAQAKNLQTNGVEGRTNGRVYRAPNALEVAGGLAKDYVGQRMTNNALSGQYQQADNQNQQYMLMLQALLRQQAAQATGPTPGAPGPTPPQVQPQSQPVPPSAAPTPGAPGLRMPQSLMNPGGYYMPGTGG